MKPKDRSRVASLKSTKIFICVLAGLIDIKNNLLKLYFYAGL